MGDGSVQVNPMHLIEYGANMATGALKHMSDYAKAVGGISENSAAAFMTLPSKTNVFAEAMTAYKYIMRDVKEFGGFIQDLQEGLAAMQSATTTMAVAYMTTDADSADSLGTLDYAFGGSGQPPKGFPTDGVTTLSAQRAAATAPQASMAAQAAQDPNSMYGVKQSVQVANGVTLYLFSDGSSLTVTTKDTGTTFLPSTTTTRQVSDPNNPNGSYVVTQTQSTDYSGNRTTSTNRKTTQDGVSTSSEVAVTNRTDGGVSVTTTTTDASGKQQSVTEVQQPGSSSAPSQPDGEIEQIEDKYGLRGDVDHQRMPGMGSDYRAS